MESGGPPDPINTWVEPTVDEQWTRAALVAPVAPRGTQTIVQRQNQVRSGGKPRGAPLDGPCKDTKPSNDGSAKRSARLEGKQLPKNSDSWSHLHSGTDGVQSRTLANMALALRTHASAASVMPQGNLQQIAI